MLELNIANDAEEIEYVFEDSLIDGTDSDYFREITRTNDYKFYHWLRYGEKVSPDCYLFAQFNRLNSKISRTLSNHLGCADVLSIVQWAYWSVGDWFSGTNLRVIFGSTIRPRDFNTDFNSISGYYHGRILTDTGRPANIKEIHIALSLYFSWVAHETSQTTLPEKDRIIGECAFWAYENYHKAYEADNYHWAEKHDSRHDSEMEELRQENKDLYLEIEQRAKQIISEKNSKAAKKRANGFNDIRLRVIQYYEDHKSQFRSVENAATKIVQHPEFSCIAHVTIKKYIREHLAKL